MLLKLTSSAFFHCAPIVLFYLNISKFSSYIYTAAFPLSAGKHLRFRTNEIHHHKVYNLNPDITQVWRLCCQVFKLTRINFACGLLHQLRYCSSDFCLLWIATNELHLLVMHSLYIHPCLYIPGPTCRIWTHLYTRFSHVQTARFRIHTHLSYPLY